MKWAGHRPSSLRPAGIAETGNQLPYLLFGFDMVRLLEDLLFFSLGQGFKPFHGSLVLRQCHAKAQRKFHQHHRG